jgi:hypothetical protein
MDLVSVPQKSFSHLSVVKSVASLKQVFEVLVIAEILLDRYVWFILIIPLMFYNKLNFIRLVFKMKKAQARNSETRG